MQLGRRAANQRLHTPSVINVRTMEYVTSGLPEGGDHYQWLVRLAKVCCDVSELHWAALVIQRRICACVSASLHLHHHVRAQRARHTTCVEH